MQALSRRKNPGLSQAGGSRHRVAVSNGGSSWPSWRLLEQMPAGLLADGSLAEAVTVTCDTLEGRREARRSLDADGLVPTAAGGGGVDGRLAAETAEAYPHSNHSNEGACGSKMRR